ncbi:hypothetical protein VTK73DRAFT_5532 [Phialemonium thermophilum]|uniref:Uncharacterized protein n=1 Tax=Phialemonium thermophilum TaxID=223376 RepID=A0ABR3V199_9PEZI
MGVCVYVCLRHQLEHGTAETGSGEHKGLEGASAAKLSREAGPKSIPRMHYRNSVGRAREIATVRSRTTSHSGRERKGDQSRAGLPLGEGYPAQKKKEWYVGMCRMSIQEKKKKIIAQKRGLTELHNSGKWNSLGCRKKKRKFYYFFSGASFGRP